MGSCKVSKAVRDMDVDIDRNDAKPPARLFEFQEVDNKQSMLFAPDYPVLEELLLGSGYLNAFDVLRLVHVSKAARSVAIPKLQEIEGVVETNVHSKMFHKWLRDGPRNNHPTGPYMCMTYYCNSSFGLQGPLRLSTIEDEWAEIAKRFVVLEYRRSYDKEESTVALFDSRGTFVALYRLTSNKVYENYVRYTSDDRILQHSIAAPNISIQTTGHLYPLKDRTNYEDTKWKLYDEEVMLYSHQNGICSNIAEPHYALIQSFAGLLSPTESMFVLMHALSGDTRSIFECTVTMFEKFVRHLTTEPDPFELYDAWEKELEIHGLAWKCDDQYGGENEGELSYARVVPERLRSPDRFR